jgi:hypothetical protein
MPLSMTSMTAVSLSRRAMRRIWPSGSVYLAAFARRFESTSPSQPGSPSFLAAKASKTVGASGAGL